MGPIRILVCRINEVNPGQLTQIAAVDLPDVEPSVLAHGKLRGRTHGDYGTTGRLAQS